MNPSSLNPRVLAGGLCLLLAAGSGYWAWRSGHAEPASEATATAPPGVLSGAQIKRLGIRLEPAGRLDAVPLGSVSGQVTLPPAARVAVTSPFAGTAERVLVVVGERVRQGQVLAVVRAPETVQFGAELARAQADLSFARSNAARLAALAREGVIAGVRADEAQATLHRIEATSRENRRLLNLAGASGDGTVALRAPIAGRIASVAIDPGSPVGGGATAPFVVENDAALALDLQLPERLAGRVSPGMAVTIAGPDGAAMAARGRIVSVAPSLDPQSRSVAARATLESGAGLLPGKAVVVIISGKAGAAGSGATVPVAAITRMNDADYVFVYAGGRFAARKVVVAATVGGHAALTEGLRPGETVAVSGVTELKALQAGR